MNHDPLPPQQLVMKDCGVHFGTTPGPCAKCRYFRALPRDFAVNARYVAVIGDKVRVDTHRFRRTSR